MVRFVHRCLGSSWPIFAPLALAIAAAMQPLAAAQPPAEMTDVYGRGVHAYFANQLAAADSYLSQVIQAGSTDPLPYYFRAMARLHSGRRWEAIGDMRLGAAYEARDQGAAGGVGQALMRIQGADRQLLEQYRRDGRANHAAQQQVQIQARYQQLERREGDVLRREKPLGLGELITPAAAAQPAAAAPPTPQPQLPAPSPAASPAADAQPAPEPAPAPTEPRSPAPAAAAGVDPFGQSESPPAAAPPAAAPAEAPAPEPAAPADDNPFGAPEEPAPAAEPAADEPPAAEPAAAEAPAIEPAPATEGADPFAPAAEEPAQEPAKLATPAAADELPAPAEAAAAGDPFGDAEPAESTPKDASPSAPAAEAPASDAAASDVDPFSPDAAAAPGEVDFNAPTEPAAEPTAEAAPSDAATPAAEAAPASNSMGGLLGRVLGRTISGMSPVGQLRGLAKLPAGAAPADQPTTPPATADAADPFGAPAADNGFGEPDAAPADGEESATEPAAEEPVGGQDSESDPFGPPSGDGTAQPAAEPAGSPANETTEPAAAEPAEQPAATGADADVEKQDPKASEDDPFLGH